MQTDFTVLLLVVGLFTSNPKSGV